jgi:hypothetical protein
MRSDSLSGWLKLPCSTNIPPAWPSPEQPPDQDIPHVLARNSFQRPQVQSRDGSLDGNGCAVRHQPRIKLTVHIP